MDASIIFANVAQVMALALEHHDTELFSKGIESLAEIWKEGSYEALYPLRPPDFEASLWENLGISLYAVGGLAALGERWAEVRLLAQQSPTGGPSEKSWLRQGQVVSARSNDEYSAESILNLASKRLRGLRPSVSEDDAKQGLAHFDLVADLIIGEGSERGFYPNAAEFSETLVETLVIDELRFPDSSLRQQVFKGDNHGLIKTLIEYDRMARLHAALARRQGTSWEWRGFSDARTLVFFAENHILEEWA